MEKRSLNKVVLSAMTRDNLPANYREFMAMDQAGNQCGKLLGTTYTKDNGSGGLITYDSTGAFLVGELERLDQTLHMPLAAVTWGRDIDIRKDVTIGDDVSSYTVSSFASNGGLGQGQGIGTGKSWIGKLTNQVATTAVNIEKISNQLTLWGNEMKYTVIELESAARLGRPVDQQIFEAMQLKWQMDIDEQVYIGDPVLNASGNTPTGGLLNHPLVSALGTVKNVPNGVSGSSWFINKTPDEILSDINDWLVSVWTKAGWAVISDKILLPPKQFGYLATQKVSTAGNMSILQYVLENNLFTRSEGKELTIVPCKWCAGAGAGGTIGTSAYDGTGSVDRAVVYCQDEKRVRFPMTLLAKTPLQYDSIWHKTTYYGRLGAVEAVYPETIGYFDGL